MAQETGGLSGYVRDAETGESLPGANVVFPVTGQGTAANRAGYFALPDVPAGPGTLRVSYIGYRDTTLAVTVTPGANTQVSLGLQPRLLELESVSVEAKSDRFGTTALVGAVVKSIQELEGIPTPGGERDLLRALQMLPGVTARNEISSGLHVRGGTADQNLILLDGVPVYNPWHLFGFFSTFNTDALKRVRLIKGVPPAEYGERLSSVLDVQVNRGRRDRVGGAAHVGIVTSRVRVEGPLRSDLTFMLSARRTYLDLVTDLIDRAQGGDLYDGIFPRYGFSDYYGKAAWDISDRDRLILTLYAGDDDFSLSSTGTGSGFNPISNEEITSSSEGGIRYGWHNSTIGLRYERVLGTETYLTLHGFTTQYGLESLLFLHADSVFQAQADRPAPGDLTLGTADARLGYELSLRDWALKADVDVFGLSRHQIRVGAHVTQHRFRDEAIARRDPLWSYLFEPDSSMRRLRPLEAALYVQDDWRIFSWARVQAGLRLIAFSSALPARLSPRLAVAFYPSSRWEIAIGAGRTTQFMQRVTDVLVPIQNDRWIPAGDEIDAADAWQIAGDVRHQPSSRYAVTVSGYHKTMDGLYTVSPFLRSDVYNERDELALLRPQTRLPIRGSGTAYGAELLLEKLAGRLTGWIGYTLAWTERSFELINDGRPFPAFHDRRHDLQAVALYGLSDNWRVSAAFTFKTGQPISLPAGYYYVDDPFFREEEIATSEEQPGGLTYDYVAYNGSRTPPFHRLDLSLEGRIVQLWGDPLTLVLDVYNVYAHSNPLYVFWDTAVRRENDLPRLEVTKFSALPVVPSLGLRYEF